MNRTSFYSSLAGALLLSLAAASVLTTGSAYRGLIAGIAGLSAYLLMQYASRGSLKTGRDDRMKFAFSTSSVLYELVLFLGAASTPVIRQNPGIGFFALAGIGMAETLGLEYRQKLKAKVSQDLGRNARVLILVASIAAFHLQQYYLFYGIALVFLVSVYDSLRLVHQIREEL